MYNTSQSPSRFDVSSVNGQCLAMWQFHIVMSETGLVQAAMKEVDKISQSDA